MPKQPRADRPDTPGRPEEHFARGFQFYLDGRHGTFCGHHESAGYLFHIAVELMLKAMLLEEPHQEAMRCINDARGPLIDKLGPDAELDPAGSLNRWRTASRAFVLFRPLPSPTSC